MFSWAEELSNALDEIQSTERILIGIICDKIGI